MAQFRIKNGLIIDNGGISVTGSISSTAGITGSFSGSIAGFPTDVSSFSSSLSTRITSTEATASQYVAASGSFSTRTTAVEATSSQYVAASSSFSTRTTNAENYISAINAKTGSYATTGSNYFIGNQVITGSVYIANDLIVQGSSSLQNITASAVSIGTNRVILNTDTPILRFGGISVQDSGSTQGRSGSLYWDSVHDHWIYVVPSGSTEGYNSAMLMNGPKNTGSLGDEAGLTTNYIPVAQGEDHITDSVMYQSGSNIGIGTTVPNGVLELFSPEVSGTSQQTRLRLSQAASVSSRVNLVSGVISGSNPYFAIEARQSASPFAVVERLRIDGSGNVGIGTTSPINRLDVLENTENTYGIISARGNNRGGALELYNGSAITAAIYSLTTNDLLFYNGTFVERMRINSSGSVGIGTTNPQGKLDITGTTSGDLLYLDAGVNTDFAYKVVSGADDAFVLRRQHTTQSGLDIMSWTYSGKVGIGTTTPSEILDIRGANRDISSAEFNQVIYTTTSQSTGFGGAIGLGGYYTGTTVTAFGGIKGAKENSTDANTAGYLSLHTRPNAGAITERMRITSGGKVGIGTLSPYGKFEIASDAQSYSTAPAITLTDTTGDGASNRWIVGNIATTYGTFNIASAPTPTSTTWTPRLSILSNGKTGIGTSAPNAPLDVTSFSTDSSGIQQWSYSGNSSSYRLQLNTIVSSGLVKYSFDMLNAGSTYNNVLVLTNGFVGIGTASPSYKLQVRGTSADWIGNFENTAGTESVGVYLAHGDGYGIAIDSSESDSKYIFKAMAGSGGGGGKGSVPIIYAQHDGKVGIGTTTPGYKLSITGNSNTLNINPHASGIDIHSTANMAPHYQTNFTWYTGAIGSGSQKASLDSSGNLSITGVLTESSAQRYKENIETLTSGLDKVSQMRGVSYNKKDTGIKEIGVIAEEINEILPDVVIKNNEGEVESVAYGRLTAILIEAVKELKAEIDVLKSK